MTLRAIIIGILGALVIAAGGYLNDCYVRVNYVVGNHLPITVFGGLIVLMVAINPLLGMIRPRWRLGSAEIGAALALILVACSIPSAGLMRTFTPTLIMPLQLNHSIAGWRSNNVLDYAPPQMLVGGVDEPTLRRAVDDFITGLGKSGHWIGLDQVPWEAWTTPLATWLPLIVLAAMAVIGLSLVVHHQWAYRERLLYPIADFATTIIQQDPSRRIGPIFHDRLLWFGLATVLIIRLINGLGVWYPSLGLEIPLYFPFDPLVGRFPTLATAPGSVDILHPPFYPTAFAFSFFLASDVALSIGISRLLYMLAMMALVNLGVEVSDSYMTGGIPGWTNFGAYVGMAMLIAYTGRRYYGKVFKAALLFRPQAEAQRYGVWGARILVVSMAGMTAMLIGLGLDWPLAVLTVLVTMLLFLVLARVNAESGVFFYKPQWYAPGVLIGMFGVGALGPKAIIIVGLLTMVLMIDPREALIPFMTNGLKITQNLGVKPSRVGMGAVGTYLLCLAVVVPLALWANYNFGLPPNEGPIESHWATYRIPKFPFDAAQQAITQLRLQGGLETSVNYTPLERLANMNPDNRFTASFLTGLGLVLLLSAARLRWTWWPIHPILLLVMFSWPVGTMSLSFLLGWMVKTVVFGLGGSTTYRRTRNLMVGVVAGDLLGGLTFMVAGWIYYAFTGLMPPSYRIFPG